MTESYEEVLTKNGTLIFTPGGNSMKPLLEHHKNPVVLVPVTKKLKRGDVPFYKRADGQYVLHRIIRVHKNSYDCCGDNQSALEKGVTDSMIIAKMAGFYQGETYVSADEAWVKRYAKRRMASRPYRRLTALAKHILKKLFRKSN